MRQEKKIATWPDDLRELARRSELTRKAIYWTCVDLHKFPPHLITGAIEEQQVLDAFTNRGATEGE